MAANFSIAFAQPDIAYLRHAVNFDLIVSTNIWFRWNLDFMAYCFIKLTCFGHLAIGMVTTIVVQYMKTLTKAEEQIMQVLWKLEKGFLKDILEAMPSPKPHSNTVATLLKILVDKEFVGTDTFGRMHQYRPLIGKQAYFKNTVNGLVTGYFGGSFTQAVSFLVEQNKLSIEDLEILLQQLKNK